MISYLAIKMFLVVRLFLLVALWYCVLYGLFFVGVEIDGIPTTPQCAAWHNPVDEQVFCQQPRIRGLKYEKNEMEKLSIQLY